MLRSAWFKALSRFYRISGAALCVLHVDQCMQQHCMFVQEHLTMRQVAMYCLDLACNCSLANPPIIEALHLSCHHFAVGYSPRWKDWRTVR